MTERTKVIFRKWPKSEGGDVIALFPELPGCDVYHITCYEQLGQHGAASIGIVQWTKPAKPREYASVARELRAIGYRLRIGHRVTQADGRRRRAIVNQYNG